MLYTLPTGPPPHASSKHSPSTDMLGRAEVIPLLERQPATPPELATIVAKALKEDRDERYPTAAERAPDLKSFQTGRPVAAHAYSLSALLARWIRRYRAPVAVA